MICLLAVFLLDVFDRAGIKLWDGKFEFGKDGRLVLADAITPDELRLTKAGVQISKEPIRQYYRRRHPDFVEAMGKAKKMAKTSRKPLSRIMIEDLKTAPARLDPGFLEAAASMYVALTVETTGIDVFGRHMSLDKVLRAFREFGVA